MIRRLTYILYCIIVLYIIDLSLGGDDIGKLLFLDQINLPLVPFCVVPVSVAVGRYTLFIIMVIECEVRLIVGIWFVSDLGVQGALDVVARVAPVRRFH